MSIELTSYDFYIEQVRTRVFNMIAEYRRILKNPSPERKKKCIFFDALHKIYQAKDNNGVKAALNNTEEDYNLDPIDFSMSDENHDHNVTDAEDGSGNETEEKEIFAYDMSPSTTLANGHNGNCTNGNSNFDGTNDVDSIGENDTNGEINGTGVNGGGSSSGGGGGAGPSSGANMRTGESNNNSCYREVNTNRNEHSTSSMYNNIHGIPCKRLRTNSSLSNSLLNMSQQQQSFVSHHQSSQSYSNILPTIDTTASVLLVDRMFAHLAKETDVMRDWVQLEKERSKEDIIRRKESAEREEKREAAFLSTLTRMQEQFFTYLSNTFNTNNSGNNKFESIENGLSASSSSAMSSGNDCSFNCHSRSKKNTNHTTSMSSTNDTGKNNNVNENDLLSNCANKFNTNGKEQVLPEMDDENFSSTSPSVVSNNVSEGEDEDTQIRSTDDLCKPDICT